jgi:CubicO group peptidase (beta-lactamase class C family)
MPFNCFNRNIPDEAHEKIKSLGPAGVRVVAFTPGGGWVVVSKNGLFARNIPDECYDKLRSFVQDGHQVRTIAFPPEGGNRWVIVTDRDLFARNIPEECYQKLRDFSAAGHQPTCIAFPYPGGNRWVILAGKALYARNIDDECFQHLVNFSQGKRPAERVAFTKTGGWFILAKDRYWARRVPDECYDKAGQFRQDEWLVDHVAFTPTGGWSLVSNTRDPNYASDPVREWESRVFKEGQNWRNIWERMAHYHVPGLGVAVALNNKVAWACSYGRVEAGKSRFVHNDTVFQAASISKPVSAVGFLKLVEDGHLTLDEDVNPKLGWTLPLRACASSSWKSKVTLRRLLTHYGGIIGGKTTYPLDKCSNFDDDGGGFGGYADGAKIPTLDEMLAGASTRDGVEVNSPRVEITHEPGKRYSYAGHAFVLMMKLLRTQKGKTFAAWMQDYVLEPAGMKHSTFELAAPSFSGPPAAGHDKQGNVLQTPRYRYPESAAAGLYTTPSDLCRLVILLNQQGIIDGRRVLDAALAREMVDAGLSLGVGGSGVERRYGHGGSNRGFKCTVKGYREQKAGAAIMTCGDQGGDLAAEIFEALIRTYGWEKEMSARRREARRREFADYS